jgi:hypothetical protein
MGDENDGSRMDMNFLNHQNAPNQYLTPKSDSLISVPAFWPRLVGVSSQPAPEPQQSMSQTQRWRCIGTP